MAFLAVGATLFGAGTFLAAATDVVIGVGASIGLSYAATELAGKPKQPAMAGTEIAHFSAQGTMQIGGVVPRSFPLGKTSTAGSLIYRNYWGTEGGTPNAYHTQVISLSDLPIKGLLGIWVYDKKCTLGDVPHAEFGRPVTEFNKDGADHLWVKFYDGNQIVADDFLVNRVSSADRPYSNRRVGYGVAYAIVTALIDDTLFTGIVSGLKFEVDGIALYDPTKDDTNGGSGTQRYSDQSTWGGDGDDLSAVQAYNVLRGIRYKEAWVYGLQNATQAMLPTINWNAQIEKCRATIDAEGGATYLSGGYISFNTRPADALTAIMTTCQGKLSEVGGWYKCHLGGPDSWSFSFTDDDILSSEEQNYKPFLTLDASINGIAATYTEPAQGWEPMPAPPLYRQDYEAIDGKRRLLATPSFDMVYRPAQAQRLTSSALLAARRERGYALVLPPRFFFIEPGDVGRWTSAREAYVNKLFEVVAVSDKANIDVGVNLQEVDPSDYAYDHNAQYIPPVYGPIVITRPAPQGVIDWDVQPVVVRDADGFPRRAGLDWTWDNTLAGVIGIRYELRLKSDQSFAASDSTDRFSEGAWLTSQSLLPNTQYQARIQYIPSAPRDMLWSDWRDVTTLDVRFTANDLDQAFVRYTATLNGALDNVVRALDILANNSSEQDLANANEFKVTRDILTKQVGALKVSITETAAIAETIDGKLAGMVFNKIDNNGLISGTINYNDGTVAPFSILATSLLVAYPGINGGQPTPFFLIDGTVDGQAAVTLNGALHGDLSITARTMQVEELIAITGNFGNGTFTGNIELDGTITGYASA